MRERTPVRYEGFQDHEPDDSYDASGYPPDVRAVARWFHEERQLLTALSAIRLPDWYLLSPEERAVGLHLTDVLVELVLTESDVDLIARQLHQERVELTSLAGAYGRFPGLDGWDRLSELEHLTAWYLIDSLVTHLLREGSVRP